MKKWISLLLCALLVLSLAACGMEKADESGQSGGDTQQSVDLKKAAEDALKPLEGTDVVLFPEENAETLDSLYPGLTAVATKQLVVYLPPVVGNACELVMAEAASAVVPYGGYYCTHMRNENVRLIPALEEALETARRSGAPKSRCLP